MKHFTLNLRWLIMSLVLCVGGGTAWGEDVTDVLNREFTGVTGTSYTAWSGKTGTSGAVYAGQSAGGNESIQLRSKNSNSGIITTASGGKVKSITVEWNNNNTSNGQTLNIYGKSSAYESAADLYDTSNQGTKLGTIVKGTSTSLTVSGDYKYIGIRSNSGALYLTSVSIVWESTSSDDQRTATTTTIYTTGITNTNVHEGTQAGQLTASVTANGTAISGATVTWSSSETGVATVDASGNVTLVAAGTTTITASYAGDEKQYQPSSDTYELTVTDIDPNAPGTENNPYTVAQARAAIDAGTGVTGVYATGIVSEIVTAYNSQYGNITYNISADGSTTSDQLQAYRGFDKNGEWFTSADDIQVGDEVVIYGNLKKHNLTYEFDAKNQLVSLKRSSKETVTLTFAETSFNVIPGSTFTAPELTITPAGLEGVKFSSSDASLAAVNETTGAVTIGNTVGSVTITATFEETEDYKSATASYTITIAKAPVTLTFAEKSFSVDPESAFTAPQLTANPSDAVVVYSTSDSEIAAVDPSTGAVTIGSKFGTATITASVEETTTHLSASDSYTIKVINPNATVFIKVTDESQLVSGMEYILVATNSQKAMGGVSENHRLPVSIELENGNSTKIAEESGVAILTLGGEKDAWTFLASDNNKYLKSGSAKGDLKSEETASNWSITRDFALQGANGTIQYNNQVNKIAIYSSDQEKLYLFVKSDGQISFVNETANTVVGFTYTNTLSNAYGVTGTYSSSDETIATVDDTGKATGVKKGTATITFSWDAQTKFGQNFEAGSVSYTLNVTNPLKFKKVTDVSDIVAGKEYILVAENNKKAMGYQIDNYYRGHVDVNITDGIAMLTDEEAAILTLGGSEGAWTFKASDNDKYLNAPIITKDDTYLESKTDATDVNSQWIITDNFYLYHHNETENLQRYVKYNKQQPRFASYKAANTNSEYAVLFVKMPDAFDVKITAAKMGTLYVGDGNLVVPVGVTAKTLKLDTDGTTLVASREYASGEVLPAGEAVVIYGEAGDYSFEYTTKAAEAVDTNNLLKGSDTAVKDEDAGYSYYILGFENGVAGFYRQKGTEAKYVNSAAHKAYLKVPNTNTNGEVKSFYVFGGDTTTGVTAIETSDRSNNVVYNLAGQRVVAPTKGLYIVNGKKVFIK